MMQDRQARPPFFSQIDVSQIGASPNRPASSEFNAEVVYLLKELLAAQDRQNELLEELLNQLNAAQRQRAMELGQWRQANPHLARRCREAAEVLAKVQTEYLENLTAEVANNSESLLDGEFMLNEFVDRFGPRVAHLNSLLQLLYQLGCAPDQPPSKSNR